MWTDEWTTHSLLLLGISHKLFPAFHHLNYHSNANWSLDIGLDASSPDFWLAYNTILWITCLNWVLYLKVLVWIALTYKWYILVIHTIVIQMKCHATQIKYNHCWFCLKSDRKLRMVPRYVRTGQLMKVLDAHYLKFGSFSYINCGSILQFHSTLVSNF